MVKPRTFTDELLPGRMMLYVSDIDAQSGDWRDLLVYDSRQPSEPRLILARKGQLVIEKARQSVRLELGEGTEHTFSTVSPRDYRQSRFTTLGFDLPFDEFFPKLPLSKGDREMTLGELQAEIDKRRREGQASKEWGRFAVEWHKKFAIPTACFVFGLLGLGLSLGSKKEARSAAFALSIAVIFVYYVLIRLGEQAGDTGLLSPFLAMWGANLVLGAAAAVLLVLNHREAAFDPLDVRHYLALVPTVSRRTAAGAAPPLPRGARPVVVLRIPRVSLRFVPTLLDRYIIRRYLGFLVLILAAFVSIFILAQFMDLFDDIQHNNVKGRVVLHYYAFYIFQVLFTVSPVAVLVTVLVTLGVLSRRNEITAMKAGGISIYRAAAPVLGLGLAVSGALLTMQELILPSTNRVAEMDFNVIKGRPPQSSGLLDRRWILASDGRFYNYDFLVEGMLGANPPRPPSVRPGASTEFSLYGLSIYAVDPAAWELRDRVYVSRAVFDPASWTYELERGWRRTIPPPGSFRRFDAERVRALGREPGGARAAVVFLPREPPVGHHGLRGSPRADREPARAGLRRGPAVGGAAPQAGLPQRGPRHDLDRDPLLVRGGPARRPLRDRDQHRDRDRLLGLPGDLRGPGQERPPRPRPRRLGSEPALRRRRPLPDAHARHLIRAGAAARRPATGFPALLPGRSPRPRSGRRAACGPTPRGGRCRRSSSRARPRP